MTPYPDRTPQRSRLHLPLSCGSGFTPDIIRSRIPELLLTALVSTGLCLPIPTTAAEINFARDIFPILERSCIECHGPTEDKGDLRLHTKEHAFAADYIIVPGAPEDSELYYLVALPPGDPDIMPSEGDPLPAIEIALLKQWIEAGAPWEDVELSINFATEAKPSPTEETLPDYEVTPAETAAITRLRANHVVVSLLAQNSNLVQVTFPSRHGPPDVRLLQALSDIANLHDLDLSGTDISDQNLGHLGAIPNLRRLNLSETGISDTGLIHLARLPALRSLNLYGTAVSDAGMEYLSNLQQLERIFLWQTQVTPTGVFRLKERLPQLEANTGADFTPGFENPPSEVMAETDE